MIHLRHEFAMILEEAEDWTCLYVSNCDVLIFQRNSNNNQGRLPICNLLHSQWIFNMAIGIIRFHENANGS